MSVPFFIFKAVMMDWRKISTVIRSPYLITLVVYLAWMLFFDANSIPRQLTITQKLNSLEAEKAYYQERIIEVKEEREGLTSNPDLLEKFARERYLMRKPTEDVYVIQYETTED